MIKLKLPIVKDQVEATVKLVNAGNISWPDF